MFVDSIFAFNKAIFLFKKQEILFILICVPNLKSLDPVWLKQFPKPTRLYAWLLYYMQTLAEFDRRDMHVVVDLLL